MRTENRQQMRNAMTTSDLYIISQSLLVWTDCKRQSSRTVSAVMCKQLYFFRSVFKVF